MNARSAAAALACALFGATAGCAATGDGPPDTAADIAETAGSAAKGLAHAVLEVAPVVSDVIDLVDQGRARLAESRGERAARKAETHAANRRWALCVANPCEFAADCAALFPELFMAPRCDRAQDAFAIDREGHVRPAAWMPSAALLDVLRAREGGPLLETSEDGHVCYGHSQNQRRVAPPDGGWTVAACEALMVEDARIARTEALNHFGKASDAHVELCYWTGCWRFKGRTPDALAEAVRNDVALKGVAPARARIIADAL